MDIKKYFSSNTPTDELQTAAFELVTILVDKIINLMSSPEWGEKWDKYKNSVTLTFELDNTGLYPTLINIIREGFAIQKYAHTYEEYESIDNDNIVLITQKFKLQSILTDFKVIFKILNTLEQILNLK